jgi:hypothetical protein
MERQGGLIKVFTGTGVVVSLLKGRLEEIGVGCLVRNDFEAGIHSGFSAGTTSSVYLFIQENDLPNAREIINEFLKNNE